MLFVCVLCGGGGGDPSQTLVAAVEVLIMKVGVAITSCNTKSKY